MLTLILNSNPNFTRFLPLNSTSKFLKSVFTLNSQLYHITFNITSETLRVLFIIYFSLAPASCPDNCNSPNGQCNNGQCVCSGTWAGVTCNQGNLIRPPNKQKRNIKK